jgi:DNA-binding XRE family transcriptional regulator
VSGPIGRLERVWTATCDSPTDFSSVAKATPMIAIARIAGTTTVTLRGPETRATTVSCPPDAEYLGVELSLGTYLPMFPPAGSPTSRTRRCRSCRTAGSCWTTAPGRCRRRRTSTCSSTVWSAPACSSALVEVLRHGDTGHRVPERTAQSRFVRAVGLSRRTLQAIERARHAAQLLTTGTAIADVVHEAGYHDQPHLTRALRQLIGQTPAVLAGSTQVLAL